MVTSNPNASGAGKSARARSASRDLRGDHLPHSARGRGGNRAGGTGWKQRRWSAVPPHGGSPKMKQQIPRKWLWSAAAAALAACSGAQGPQGPEGPPGQQGATGAAGAAGAAGQNALVAVAAEAAGANCSGGGISVRSGIDSNGNGTLDAAEVTNTSYVCNGSLDTPAQVLAKVETVDGAGSGLDADLLQGQSLDTVSPAG